MVDESVGFSLRRLDDLVLDGPGEEVVPAREQIASGETSWRRHLEEGVDRATGFVVGILLSTNRL